MTSFKALMSASMIALAVASPLAAMEKNPMVGGAAMYAAKNIVENAVNSADHTTLVAAVKTTGLVETLSGPGRSVGCSARRESLSKRRWVFQFKPKGRPAIGPPFVANRV